MWDQATEIKWLGKKPKEVQIPFFERPMSTRYVEEYYKEHGVLQDTLLRIFTYQNIPKGSLSYSDIQTNDIGCEEEFNEKKKALLEYIGEKLKLNSGLIDYSRRSQIC